MIFVPSQKKKKIIHHKWNRGIVIKNKVIITKRATFKVQVFVAFVVYDIKKFRLLFNVRTKK